MISFGFDVVANVFFYDSQVASYLF